MKDLNELTQIQQNILLASIIGDGEITKIYKDSRRKNNSYREHFGKGQLEYRKWKASWFPNLLYINPKSYTLCSKSLPIFTSLYPHFYNPDGHKSIPQNLLSVCTLPHFLAILYMDDGTLSISKQINHRKKKIYLTPHIFLYLQNYSKPDLDILKNHISNQFDITFSFGKRNDGQGYILRFTSTSNTFLFLNRINTVTISCPSMYYKTQWDWRFTKEIEKYSKSHPGYHVIVSSSERNKAYSSEEIAELINLKQKKVTDKEIATKLNRSYWSIVYKIRELRKEGHFQ